MMYINVQVMIKVFFQNENLTVYNKTKLNNMRLKRGSFDCRNSAFKAKERTSGDLFTKKSPDVVIINLIIELLLKQLV